MPFFYARNGEKLFTYHPRGILDGTDDEFEFEDDYDNNNCAASLSTLSSKVRADSFSGDATYEAVVDDYDDDVETLIMPDEASYALEDESTGIQIDEHNKENVPVEVPKNFGNTEDDEEGDLDRKPRAKTKEELEAAKEKKLPMFGNDLGVPNAISVPAVASLPPTKMMDLKWWNKKEVQENESKKYVEVPGHFRKGKYINGYTKLNSRRRSSSGSKKEEGPPFKKKKKTEEQKRQEKNDEALARSLQIAETLRLTRGKMF